MPGSTKLEITGPAGRLEALWRSGEGSEAFSRATIVCHPHPQYGGTMENKVVARIARYVSEAGIDAVRFNFRGTGRSEGSFDSGRGERDDLRAVIEYVAHRAPTGKIAIVGFSFGAWIGLDVGRQSNVVKALVGVAPPVRMFDFGFFTDASKPTLIIYAENDQYTPSSTTKAWLESSATESLESACIPDVDHFFGPQVDNVGRKVAEFLTRVL